MTFDAYIKAMKRKTSVAVLLLLSACLVCGSAVAQNLPDPALERAQTQAQVNQQLQQTQQNNTQMQMQLQQNQANQQQLFNSMPPPAYQQPLYAPPPARK
jgi:outer membrane biogenesis lipoprotein LolB